MLLSEKDVGWGGHDRQISVVTWNLKGENNENHFPIFPLNK